MNVIERFSSIEGEGTRQGFPCSFLRLYDCNLRCVYCDTTYSYGDEVDFEIQSVEEVADALKEMGNRYITITGGEPLLQAAEVEQLIDILSLETTPFGPYEFNIETNGSIIAPFQRDNVFYTYDYKCPDSSAEESMHPQLCEALTADMHGIRPVYCILHSLLFQKVDALSPNRTMLGMKQLRRVDRQ